MQLTFVIILTLSVSNSLIYFSVQTNNIRQVHFAYFSESLIFISQGPFPFLYNNDLHSIISHFNYKRMLSIILRKNIPTFIHELFFSSFVHFSLNANSQIAILPTFILYLLQKNKRNFIIF